MSKLISMNLLLMMFIGIISINKSDFDVPKFAAKHIVILEDENGSGTGFYVMFKGKSYLVSNKHVCKGVDGLDNGEGFQKVIALSTEHDLCLLQSNRKQGLDLSKTDLKVLDKVHVVGYPLGNPVTAREGRYVTHFSQSFPWISQYPVDVMHVSVTAFGGSSGSPILDDNGQVVGVLFATDERTYEDSLGVPKDALIKFLNTHIHK